MTATNQPTITRAVDIWLETKSSRCAFRMKAMSIVKQKEGTTRNLQCFMETVVMAATGDLSIVKVMLTRAKGCREEISNTVTQNIKTKLWAEMLACVCKPITRPDLGDEGLSS